jgi:glucans biosynthesis protein C
MPNICMLQSGWFLITTRISRISNKKQIARWRSKAKEKESKMHKTERIHSLDSLRAIMMLLGLVLHSALTYNITYHGGSWPLKDPQTTHLFSDFLVLLIHSFRMPIFFLVAGFFGAMLFYERQPIEMIKNRVRRIAMPFVVFLFILYPLIVLAFRYTNAAFSHQENPFEIALKTFSNISVFLPKSTSHLWFLYYLAMITGTAVILGLLLKNVKWLTHLVTKIFDWLIQRPLVRILFFSCCVFIVLSVLGTHMVESSRSLIPDVNTFSFFLFFYLTGWILFKSKKYLETFKRYDWACLALAILLSIIQGLIITNSDLTPNGASSLLIMLSSLVVCLFMFGITGLFIRYGSNHSARMRYISDASYWIYLIHLPFTAIIPAFIWKLPFPAVAKFLIVLSVSTIICLFTYHYLVRDTFIGKFLNGRKYPRNKILETVKLNGLQTDINKVEQESQLPINRNMSGLQDPVRQLAD